MFRPQIQKTSTLFLIAIFNVLMVYFAVTSTVKVKQSGYDHKIMAVENMYNSLETIKKLPLEIPYYDKFNSGIIGIDKSPITSINDLDSLMLESKQIVSHPNFAALIIELFYDAEINSGDTIAVSMTGSFPGANIALYAACRAMNITPIVISSVASSAWGANRVQQTWPKIENYLYNNNKIKHKSIAYSIGGKNDIGTQMSSESLEIIVSIIHDYVSPDTKFINNSRLNKNIEDKLDLFRTRCKQYSGYVNIGGGATSLGSGIGKDTMQVGFISLLDFNDLEISNTFEKSIAYQIVKENSIPLINIKNIKKLMGDHRLNSTMYKGDLFYTIYNYNPAVIIIGILSTLLLIVSIGIYSHTQIRKRMENNDFDSVV